jgi:hypothetical protein
MDQIEPDIQVLGRLSVQKARWDMLTPMVSLPDEPKFPLGERVPPPQHP